MIAKLEQYMNDSGTEGHERSEREREKNIRNDPGGYDNCLLLPRPVLEEIRIRVLYNNTL